MNADTFALVLQALSRVPHSIDLGRDLLRQGAVLSLSLDSTGKLNARVRSSRGGRGYDVFGALPPGKLYCNCSWGGDCKHVAAVLLRLHEGDGVAAQGARGPRARGARQLTPSSPPLAEPSVLASEVRAWLTTLRGPAPLQGGERLAFRLEIGAGDPVVYLAAQRPLKSGAWGQPLQLSRLRAQEVIAGREGEEDLLDAIEAIQWTDSGSVKLRGRRGGRGLAALLDSGRLVLAEPGPPVLLTRGETVTGELAWKTVSGYQEPTIKTSLQSIELLPVAPVHYLERETGRVGVIEISGDSALPMRWIAGPRIAPGTAATVTRELSIAAPRAPSPSVIRTKVVRDPPRGVLHLREVPVNPWRVGETRVAELSFRYGSIDIPSGNATDPFVVSDTNEMVYVERSRALEDRLRRALEAVDLHAQPMAERGAAERWTMASVADWLFLLSDKLESLREAGFDVVVDPTFKLELVESEDWYTDLEPAGHDWFDVELGIQVGGERISLLPLLVQVLGKSELPPQGFFIQLPDGRYAHVPSERIAPLADLIIELAATRSEERRYRVTRLRSMDLAASSSEQSATFEALRALRERLTTVSSIPKLAIPEAFLGELREYQAQGVAWLDFLGKMGLGGVLADDMGLGKTVQIIALLCALKESPRPPSIIVAPTSVLLSWTQQLERFAPHLKVVLWHGADRIDSRDQIASSDLVLTSYALLRRDATELAAIEWDLCVLDEAQTIKNAKTVFAEKARELRARQRIALTGTPMENHLGELWSIVSFALPGALGGERAFRLGYRTPIEKRGDAVRLESLRRRLAPVLLRRTKEQVATELPPKTIIDHPIELDDAQRDLYETIRAAVAKRVRDEIEKKGLARSHIVLLDALLKLRQVCCDPRLLKTSVTKRAVTSAKLEAFEDLVTTVVAEGRKVLVFSQFVEMLEILSASLDRLGIEHETLTGSTRDRAGVVASFRTGEAAVFLISLKAGGTGLDLVEADTVIHYDPWWNPAVEAQATDRAHRIGQTRPVFVHKLIARGTVEEKILGLQGKKAELARGLLDGTSSFKLDAASVEALLAPLPSRS